MEGGNVSHYTIFAISGHCMTGQPRLVAMTLTLQDRRDCRYDPPSHRDDFQSLGSLARSGMEVFDGGPILGGVQRGREFTFLLQASAWGMSMDDEYS